MPLQFTNNAATTLSAGYSDAATTMVVAAGKGALFPTPAGASVFRATIVRASDSAIEIVEVTARTTATMTVVRAREGTSALTLVAGDKFELRITAGFLNDTASLTQVQSLTNKTITDIVYALSGTTPAFTATNGGVQTWTLSGASTPTNSLTTGQSIILVITPGANTITWPSVTWTKQGGSGAAPTLFSAGKTSVVLWMVGSTLYGSHLGDTV